MGRLTKNPPLAKNAGTATSGQLPGGTTGTRPSGTFEGELRYNTSNTALEYWDSSAWQQIGATGLVSITKDSFTGDASTTAFVMSKTVATASDIIVIVGGVFQNPVVSFTVDGSTTVTFTSAPPNLEAIIVLHGYNEVT